MGNPREFYEFAYATGRHHQMWHVEVLPEAFRGAVPASGQGLRALDLGAGAGTASVLLAQRGYAVTSLDLAPSAVKLLHERARAANVIVEALVGDVLEPRDAWVGAFDVIVDRQCLQDLSDADRPRFATHVRQWLKPTGRYIVEAFTRPPGAPPVRGMSTVEEGELERLFEGSPLSGKTVLGELARGVRSLLYVFQ